MAEDGEKEAKNEDQEEAETAKEKASKQSVGENLLNLISVIFDFCDFLGSRKHKTKVEENLQEIHHGFNKSEISVNFNGKPVCENWKNKEWEKHFC